MLRACAEAREHGFAGRVRPPRRGRRRARRAPRLRGAGRRGGGLPARRGRHRRARRGGGRGGAERGRGARPGGARSRRSLAGRFEEVLDDLRAVVRAVPVPVKVILETARLTRDQKVAGAALARCAGAAFVKTSTGFGGGGATVEDVALLRAVVGDGVGVKASGGIRTAADALAMIRAGASRVGASSSVAIVTGAF